MSDLLYIAATNVYIYQSVIAVIEFTTQSDNVSDMVGSALQPYK